MCKLRGVAATIDAEAAKQAWGNRLANARLAAGLNQAAVAQLTGLEQQTVSRAERGLGRMETFVDIANVLDITLFEVPA